MKDNNTMWIAIAAVGAYLLWKNGTLDPFIGDVGGFVDDIFPGGGNGGDLPPNGNGEELIAVVDNDTPILIDEGGAIMTDNGVVYANGGVFEGGISENGYSGGISENGYSGGISENGGVGVAGITAWGNIYQ